MTAPANPPIFHITHVDNLPGIIAEGCLWCDAQRIQRGIGSTNIGYRHIKARRLARTVDASVGGTLGEYVPFNFCPRSVMLYACRNGHVDYGGGQEGIVHLVSSVDVATSLGLPWAFSDRHAELAQALHYDNMADLDEVPWHVMHQRYWAEVREEKQAEFLVHDHFPWSAVLEVAAMTEATAAKARNYILQAEHQPRVTIRPDWYY